MGFYLRKSFNFGGVRFNLSKSGVGTSVGVKGFRIGSGPRGNYIHMGRKGLFYRAALGTSKNKKSNDSQQQNVTNQQTTYEDGLLFHEIESKDISQIVDSSSQELVNEINTKIKKIPFWPFALLLLFIPGAGPVLGIIMPFLIYFLIDKRRKTTVLFYDIDEAAEASIQKFYDVFQKLMNCSYQWHISAQAQTNDKKYHAGADAIVKRTKIKIEMKAPQYIKTNVQVPSVPVGKQTLYFFPDKIFIFEKKKVSAISYEHLDIEYGNQQFVESETVPKDGKIVDHTWKYVNKSGGPDKRFKDNPEYPIMLYSVLNFSSSSGLNERIQLSKPDVAEDLALQLDEYKKNNFLVLSSTYTDEAKNQPAQDVV